MNELAPLLTACHNRRMSTNTSNGVALEAWAGEVRVNLIRLLGLVVFYGHHLLQYHFLRDDPWRTVEYHQAVTGVVVAWGGLVALLHLLTIRDGGPWANWRDKPWIKYVVTLMDLLFIFALVRLHPEGVRGPLTLLLFLVIAAAPVRFSLRLVYVATLGAMLTFVLLIGVSYTELGAARYYAAENARRVPRPQQAIMLLCLGGAGLLAGQVVRQARRLLRAGGAHA